MKQIKLSILRAKLIGAIILAVLSFAASIQAQSYFLKQAAVKEGNVLALYWAQQEPNVDSAAWTKELSDQADLRGFATTRQDLNWFVSIARESGRTAVAIIRTKLHLPAVARNSGAVTAPAAAPAATPDLGGVDGAHQEIINGQTVTVLPN